MRAQSVLAAANADGDSARSTPTQTDASDLAGPGTDAQATSPPHAPENSPQQQPYPWHIAAYPALAWAPIFGSSMTLPPTPSNPIETPSGSTETAFNAAYFGGVRYEQGKWSADALFMWAALHAERTTPSTRLSLDFVFGDAMAGYEVLSGLYVEGGFRRLALDIDATIEDDNAKRSPGYWDPLIGATYRRELGKKWRILVHGDGGGFGVGSDVDIAATGRAEWQFVRHAGLTFGYGGMHLSDTDTKPSGTLKVSPTMHGPIIGFGAYF